MTLRSTSLHKALGKRLLWLKLYVVAGGVIFLLEWMLRCRWLGWMMSRVSTTRQCSVNTTYSRGPRLNDDWKNFDFWAPSSYFIFRITQPVALLSVVWQTFPPLLEMSSKEGTLIVFEENVEPFRKYLKHNRWLVDLFLPYTHQKRIGKSP